MRVNIGFNASSVGPHRVKNVLIWEEEFAFHILKNMAQNDKGQPFKSNGTTFEIVAPEKYSYQEKTCDYALENSCVAFQSLKLIKRV